MKKIYILNKEGINMNYIRKLAMVALPLFGLIACGGEENTDTQTQPISVEISPIVEQEKELNSLEILAQPDATFKTTKTLDYLAYNESENNITLFITNTDGNRLARYRITAGDYVQVKVQLQKDETTIIVRWHLLENVEKHYVEVADLAYISFDGFQ
jgi:hypothetical protein